MRKLILATSLFLSLSPAAQAALFGDDEARKKIGEIQVQNQATQATLNELKANQQALEKRLAEIEAMLNELRSPFRTAEAFGIEEIIDPRETRPLLCDWAAMAYDMIGNGAGPKRRGIRP